MSAHEERRAQAFRKTDESKQTLIVGFTILLGSIRSFSVYPAPLRANQYRSQRLRRRSYGKHKERLPSVGGNSRSARSSVQIREPPARAFRSKPFLEAVPCPVRHPLRACPVTSVITAQSIWEILSLKYRTHYAQIRLLYKSNVYIGDKFCIDEAAPLPHETRDSLHTSLFPLALYYKKHIWGKCSR